MWQLRNSTKWSRTWVWSSLTNRSDFSVHPTFTLRLSTPPTTNIRLLRLRSQPHLNRIIFISVPTSPTNGLFLYRCQPHLNSINKKNNEWSTVKKLSSHVGYYKCKLKRMNVSIMNYQSLAQAWRILVLKRF